MEPNFLSGLFQSADAMVKAANSYIDVLTLAFGATASGGAFVWASMKANNAIRKGHYDGHEAVRYKTFYSPSGIINPATSREFYDQNIITLDNSVNLEEIFHKGARREILRYLDKAKKLCTLEEPIVFQHLPKVIPAKYREDILEQIDSQWGNYFSTNKNQEMASPVEGGRKRKCNPRLREIMSYEIPVLYFDPDAKKKQYRIAMISAEQFETAFLPNPENLRIKIGFQRIHDINHKHTRRLLIDNAIIRNLRKNPKLVDFSMVEFETGEMRHVPEPVLIQDGHGNVIYDNVYRFESPRRAQG
jgi:hypothetical protein